MSDLRAEFTKAIVKPVLGVAGVGGAMVVYGAFDAIVSIRIKLHVTDFHLYQCVLVMKEKEFTVPRFNS